MRGKVLEKLAENELLAQPETIDYILKQKNPLAFCDKLKGEDFSGVITLKDLKGKFPKQKKRHRDRKKTVVVKKPKIKVDTSVEIRNNFTKCNAKADLQNFISYFNDRYEKISSMLRNRGEVQNLVSIQHLVPGEKCSIIGMVSDIRTTKNGHRMIEVEDQSGKINVLAGKYKMDLFKLSENILLDEIIAFQGTAGDGIFFCDSMAWPDIPLQKTPKTCNDPVSVAFLSDIHVGSDHFLEKEFLKLISWINGKIGSASQKEVASKIKYIVVAGDIIDGVGVYPGQEKELTILDVHEQFAKADEYFQLIRNDIEIIISPGNHDAVRLPQPQPPLDKIADCFKSDNMHLVSNPASVRIHNLFDILIYHGVSFDKMVSSIPSLSNGYSQPQLIMEALLKRRHLSPSYGMDIATEKEDTLVIGQIPDIVHSGHVHSNGQSIYRGVRIINSGTWQSQTPFQVMVGHTPTPCKLPVLDLQENKLQIIDFK
ncbi:DNA-directed DNA polymerase II small subunit [Candidatus Undinarchaeota archaeon]